MRLAWNYILLFIYKKVVWVICKQTELKGNKTKQEQKKNGKCNINTSMFLKLTENAYVLLHFIADDQLLIMNVFQSEVGWKWCKHCIPMFFVFIVILI